MTVTAHMLVGGAIATSVHNPVLGIGITLLSHHIMDLIPHWDEGWGWRTKPKLRFFAESAIDLGLGVLLSYLFFYVSPIIGQRPELWYFVACIIASIAADLMEVPYLFLDWRVVPFSTFYKIQHKMQGKVKLPWGILTQVATVAGVVAVLAAIY